MSTQKLRACLALGTLMVACGSSQGPERRSDDTIAVLFIGNSLTYTNDMPGMLDALLDSAGTPGYIASVALPNFGLEDHWAQGRALDSIRAGGWDFVIMQQGPSATEGRPSLLDLSARFANSIRAVGAEPAMYMVWPSQFRSFDFDGVSDSYRTAAENIDGRLFPVGDAWQLVWDVDPSVPLYSSDGFHPSGTGSFLAAAVIYAGVTGADPRQLPKSISFGNGSRISLGANLGQIILEAATQANSTLGR